jgi:hypothetical protein
MFSQDDLTKIRYRGSNPDTIEQQLTQFKEGFPFAEIVVPASLERGIFAYSKDEKMEFANFFDQHKSDFDICRFVPASGAATRMFKSLFSLQDILQTMSKTEQWEYVQTNSEENEFFTSLEEYPFYNDLLVQAEDSPIELLGKLLSDKGLNYGSLPKGMLKFHKYLDNCRTAFEEHLHEAARLLGSGSKVNLHFTVSEEHLEGFQKLERVLVPELEKLYDLTFDLTYSFQKKETDTIAVDMNNKPLRDEEGELVFRPGGHGALIENLNDLGNGILFLNNIDNVSPDKNSDLRLLNKKLLGGVLLKQRITVHALLNNLQKNYNSAVEKEAITWLNEIALCEVPENIYSRDLESRKQWIFAQLNKPLRVCGMVKNEGEQGGGPFFVRNSRGGVSLQIVEPSQVNSSNAEQAHLFSKSSHFNPVDIACSVKRPDGSNYALQDYVDSNTGFISEKSVKGKDLKALELPGLWNGSMAGWNTIFVEIPAATFTPVKTIFDLIRPSHQN